MEITLKFKEYSRQTGAVGTWVDGYEIDVSVHDGEVLISANREGLLSLATHLVTLAQDGVPSGHHFHLDPGYGVEPDSNGLILQRK
jgi:hypothetical protein